MELAVGRPPFAEYRTPRTPAPIAAPVRSSLGAAPPSLPAPPSPSAPVRAGCVRRAAPPARAAPPSSYRGPAVRALPSPGYGVPFPAPPPPPPYRQQARPMRPPQQIQHSRVTQEDLQALLPPPTASMDQKTQSSFQVSNPFLVISLSACRVYNN